VEELHLASRLARGLGTPNIDHRVRQSDFRLKTAGAPWLGMPIESVSHLQSVLLVGSSIRKEQPLIAARLRQAVKKGAALSVVHVAADDLAMRVAASRITRPDGLAGELAAVAAAVAQAAGKPVGGEVGKAIGEAEKAIAATLVSKERSAILLGQYAQQHPDFAILYAIAQEIGRLTGAIVGLMPDGANAVGAHLAGALPQARGLDARAMIDKPRRGYLVMGLEAEHDMGPRALQALGDAEFGVVLSAYRNATTDKAHVILPIAPFTETAGTFVNAEGRAQTFNAVANPQGEARPGWKVLRMLGSILELPDFHAETLQDVQREISADLAGWARQGLDNTAAQLDWNVKVATAPLERVAEFSIYGGDPIVRRSAPLQRTADAKAARSVRMHPDTAATLKLAAGDSVRVRAGEGEVQLAVKLDPALAAGTLRIARGIPETAALGEGVLSVEKVSAAVAA
jgi:NADH-quinone oxidoreductase subunit G